MEARVWTRVAALAGGVLLAVMTMSRTLSAQSAGDLGAWDGLMLSPLGALAPIAHDPGEGDAHQSDLWLRYGRWRYDVDDAIHSSFGVTLFRRPRSANTELFVTVASLALSCPNCSSWLSGGVGIESTFRRCGVVGHAWRTLAVRADLGGARYLGAERTTAASAAAAVVFSGGAPFVRHSHISYAFSEGFGIGRIAFVDGIDGGARPTLSAAFAWTSNSGFALNVGMERIVLAEAPPQLGLGLSWRVR